MDEFIRCISKLAVVSGIVVTVILFVVTGVLLLAPGVIFKAIYYVLILGCAAGTGYFFLLPCQDVDTLPAGEVQE